jgi:hypothetical protein
VKDHNRHRLDLITGRHAARKHDGFAIDRERYFEAFRAARDEVIRPVLEDVAAELRARGHAPQIALDQGPETPSIEIRLGIDGAPREPGSDRVAFSVIDRRGALEVLAFLTVKPSPMDLVRYARPEEISADEVEQLVIDAVEHIFACRSV